MSITFVDLFAGIGGFHLALAADPMWGECVYACDIDENCRQTYGLAFPRTPLGTDIQLITEPKADGFVGELRGPLLRSHILSAIPKHDLLCAGFPCQPFSKSGHQRGIEETRGTLFFDILRVLEARRPQFILLENVMNLVGPRHTNTWRTIIDRLRALGYAVSDSPTILSPHALPRTEGGRPQHRERVYIPAIWVGDAALHMTSLGPLVERWPFGTPPTWAISEFLDESDPPDLMVREDQRAAINIWNDLLEHLSGPIPGVPLWSDSWFAPTEIAGLPEWKAAIITRNLDFATQNREVIDAWRYRHPQLGSMFASYRKFEWQAGHAERDAWRHAIQFRPSGIRVRPLTYLPALVAINQTSIIGPRARRISSREAARLQGFPEDFPLSPKDAYKQVGNAVSVGVARFVARALILGTRGLVGEQAPMAWIEARALSDRMLADAEEPRVQTA